MAITLQHVRQRLSEPEVDYSAAAELGDDALPHLAELATRSDTVLACKALYLASLIGGPRSTEIIADAAEHDDPIIRIAASAALRNLRQAERTR
ncbi:hypothetical protein [Actinokineospora globicatena]|uniref:hypothetical protein n=1 Tax=Actinokineospora globicatena TaxID=103729 RepID=UPI0020A2E991|nr:hypothetical protein [Actinokineospora globicatena]MCP2305303.1 hypothetical protein [Actinokineospora globicatena]GLW80780.1 hypothetical protein Aglo01_52610 [Actinokineospora globicatena]GLW87607.1 hypothetical protein Aglo02_52460 [Actinokineospora globicatena]